MLLLNYHLTFSLKKVCWRQINFERILRSQILSPIIKRKRREVVMGWWVLAYHTEYHIMIPFETQTRIDPIKLAVVYGIRQKTVTQHKNETN